MLERFPRRGGESGARWRRIIGMHERTLAELDGRGKGRGLPDGRELRAFGRDLFETLLPGDVRRLFDVAREQRRSRPLDLVFTSMLDWVADKPWELAFDPSRREFLATSSVNFVRNAYTAVPADWPAAAPRPAARAGRRVAPEGPAAARRPHGDGRPAQGVRAARGQGRGRDRAGDASDAGRAAAAARQRAASTCSTSSATATTTRASARASSCWRTTAAAPRPFGAEALGQLVCKRGLSLVFLNACETGRGGRVDWNRGTAPALVAAGVPAVVANQYAVLDTAATLFARELYAELAQGRAIGDAAREARIALGRELGASRLDWAVPVVFARDPREPLR